MECNDKITAFSSASYMLMSLGNEKATCEDNRLRAMCNYVPLDLKEFCKVLKSYEALEFSSIYKGCIRSLKNCDQVTQIMCMAWLINIAYSDSIMTNEEWKFIFKLYKTELHLNHTNIMAIQIKLPSIFKFNIGL